ncbi:MAG: sporulation protein, partial [Paenibacillus sp.]|nr:sporulation protein [Paenibacillus sp.]
EVSKRGPSGRAIELKANGQPITVQKSDQYRNALFDAPSTRFEIEETGRYTVLGANGQTRSLPETKGTLYATGKSSAAASSASPIAGPAMIIMGQGGTIRTATKDPSFRLTGSGSGHGLGMSQWGARGLAESGYDYKRILQYYYIGITITKD